MKTQKRLNANKGSFAFFDVDDTLISVKSMLSFQDYWYKITKNFKEEKYYREDIESLILESNCWNLLNRRYYQHFRGRSVSDTFHMGKKWLKETQLQNNNFYHKKVVCELRQHQREGREVVFVSGSFSALLNPIADELNVNTVLCTKLESVNGFYSGEILPPQTIGEGKAEAIRNFLNDNEATGNRCYAYGDDISDLPMLQCVGHPTIVSGGRGLESHSSTQGWRIITPA